MFVPRTHTCKHVERRNVATRWPTEADPARQLHVCITAALGTRLHGSTPHVETEATRSCAKGAPGWMDGSTRGVAQSMFTFWAVFSSGFHV